MVLGSILRAEADRIYRVPIDQGEELDGLVRTLVQRNNPLTHGFIEIGAGAGGSFHVWARCIPLGPKISIDFYDSTSRDHVERTWGKRNQRSYREIVWSHTFEDTFPIFKPSADYGTVEDVTAILETRQVDFLFIDGRWQDVGFNFWEYRNFVRKGGLIAIHCIHSERPDAAPVRELWEHLKTLYTTAEFAYGPHRSGLRVGGTGVVFV